LVLGCGLDSSDTSCEKGDKILVFIKSGGISWSSEKIGQLSGYQLLKKGNRSLNSANLLI